MGLYTTVWIFLLEISDCLLQQLHSSGPSVVLIKCWYGFDKNLIFFSFDRYGEKTTVSSLTIFSVPTLSFVLGKRKKPKSATRRNVKILWYYDIDYILSSENFFFPFTQLSIEPFGLRKPDRSVFAKRV
jgi:hypothetical protein